MSEMKEVDWNSLAKIIHAIRMVPCKVEPWGISTWLFSVKDHDKSSSQWRIGILGHRVDQCPYRELRKNNGPCGVDRLSYRDEAGLCSEASESESWCAQPMCF